VRAPHRDRPALTLHNRTPTAPVVIPFPSSVIIQQPFLDLSGNDNTALMERGAERRGRDLLPGGTRLLLSPSRGGDFQVPAALAPLVMHSHRALMTCLHRISTHIAAFPLCHDLCESLPPGASHQHTNHHHPVLTDDVLPLRSTGLACCACCTSTTQLNDKESRRHDDRAGRVSGRPSPLSNLELLWT